MIKTEFIDDFIKRYDYPESAVHEIDRLFEKSQTDKYFEADMESIINKYFDDTSNGLGSTQDKIFEISKKYNEDKYTLCLFFLILALPYSKEIYDKKGLGENIFYDTMDDIRCKLNECIECKEVPGTFVLTWYNGILNAETISLGRFEYEVSDFGFKEYTFSDGKTIKKGDITINFHIPSSGVPISDEVRFDSYKKAYEHFKHLYPDGKVVFECSSWLLYPEQKKFLPEKSNILRFIDDFVIIESEKRDKFYDAWRVFGKYADLPPKKLPRDNSMRKAYSDWMSKGRQTGFGRGIFAFDGEKIIK